MANLLLVDDDEDLAAILAELLAMQGHLVRIGRDGAEGLELLAQESPDLIILDVDMPILSGPDMVRRMVAHDAGWETIPIVLMSGVANLNEIAREVGTPYVLAKPVPAEVFLSTVAAALDQSALATPNPSDAR